MVVATELAAPRAEPSLNALAAKATVNCLMGCAAGEITGMAIGTALGWSNVATLILAVGLAFLFGYALTSVPLVRSGLAVAAVVPIALAADTVSIAIMEAIDNAVVWAVPGAMDAGLTDAAVGAAVGWICGRVRAGLPRQPRRTSGGARVAAPALGCKRDTDRPMSQEKVELIRRLLEAWAAGDMVTVETLSRQHLSPGSSGARCISTGSTRALPGCDR